jgi:hypothetical protein
MWDVPVHAEGDGSFMAWDRSPRLAESSTVTYTLFYLGEDGDWIQLAQQSVDLQGVPVVTRLLHPFPNPFNPRTTIPFALARAQEVRLTIHDAAGREVVRLARGEMRPGQHVVKWDGRDSGGRQVGTGVYFARLQTTDGSFTGKLVLAK